jgi:nitroreductase
MREIQSLYYMQTGCNSSADKRFQITYNMLTFRKGANMATRKSAYPISEFILNRWSPRAMDPDQWVSKNELMALFEAARWAQSSYNNQPWRFIYAQRNTPFWEPIFNLLVPPNQSWTKNASYLVLVISRNNFTYNNEFSRTHSFDTGAACENFALQGSINNIVVHGMEGFDYNQAKQVCHIPEGYTVEAMFAVGKPGKVSFLPPELQKREVMSDRKPLNESLSEGIFKE